MCSVLAMVVMFVETALRECGRTVDGPFGAGCLGLRLADSLSSHFVGFHGDAVRLELPRAASCCDPAAATLCFCGSTMSTLLWER